MIRTPSRLLHQPKPFVPGPESGQNTPWHGAQEPALKLHGLLCVFEDRHSCSPAPSFSSARLTPLHGQLHQCGSAAEGIEGWCCQRNIHLVTAESRARLQQVPTVTLFSLSSQEGTRTMDWSTCFFLPHRAPTCQPEGALVVMNT